MMLNGFDMGGFGGAAVPSDGTSYSDETPSVALVYDAMGRLASATDGMRPFLQWKDMVVGMLSNSSSSGGLPMSRVLRNWDPPMTWIVMGVDLVLTVDLFLYCFKVGRHSVVREVLFAGGGLLVILMVVKVMRRRGWTRSKKGLADSRGQSSHVSGVV